MKNAVIIGAGPAGLTAAYELLTNSDEYTVTILEESNDIGGISRTIQHNGNRMDIGGHRFFSREEKIVEWWEKILPLQGAPAIDDLILNRKKELSGNGPDPEQTDSVMLLRDRVSRIYYNGHFFDYPVTLNFNTIKNMGFAQTAKAGCGYLYSVVRKRPENSLEDFYINRFGSTLYAMFFEGYTEKLWGRHPRDISADWGAQRVKGLSITAVIKNVLRKAIPLGGNAEVETSLIEQFLYPKYGPGQLWEHVADIIASLGGEIKKNCRVNSIEAGSDIITKVGYLNGNERKSIASDVVISSMPVKDLLSAWKGSVPNEVMSVSKDLPYRDFVTVGLLVPKLKLINETKCKTLGDIIPDCWIYIQEPSVKVGRLQIFNNWSPYMVKDPVNTVWIGMEYFCNEGDRFWNLSDEECVAFAVKELVAMGIIDHGAVTDSHRAKVKKAYPAYFDSYKDMSKIIAFLDKFSNLYCIGRNGQHRYNNMDHSMMTAVKAVDNILRRGNGKVNIWEVNTEKTYHEQK